MGKLRPAGSLNPTCEAFSSDKITVKLERYSLALAASLIASSVLLQFKYYVLTSQDRANFWLEVLKLTVRGKAAHAGG